MAFVIHARYDDLRERVERAINRSLSPDQAQSRVDGEVDLDLLVLDHEDVLQQFIADGGEPWEVWRAEEAFLGARLEDALA